MSKIKCDIIKTKSSNWLFLWLLKRTQSKYFKYLPGLTTRFRTHSDCH